MLFMFELLLAIIIVAVRYYLKNKEKYRIKIKRIILKVMATVLAILLTITVLLQELIQQLLDKISSQETKLKLLDKIDRRK